MRLEFSRRAEIDLENIEDYSVQTFGALVAHDYIASLIDCCNAFKSAPEMGTIFKLKRQTYYRFAKASHIIIYRKYPDRITIMRVLHQSQIINAKTLP
jgi:plasmid stabilization system protein ParE